VQRELRRRWFYLLPAVFVTYSLAYLDRANYGFGAAAGLAKTLQHHQLPDPRCSVRSSSSDISSSRSPASPTPGERAPARLVFYSLIALGFARRA
jgi:hypothetical protein